VSKATDGVRPHIVTINERKSKEVRSDPKGVPLFGLSSPDRQSSPRLRPGRQGSAGLPCERTAEGRGAMIGLGGKNWISAVFIN